MIIGTTIDTFVQHLVGRPDARSGASGAPPEMKNRIRPPVRARSLAKTRRSAIRRATASDVGTGCPSITRTAQSSPTRLDLACVPRQPEGGAGWLGGWGVVEGGEGVAGPGAVGFDQEPAGRGWGGGDE